MYIKRGLPVLFLLVFTFFAQAVYAQDAILIGGEFQCVNGVKQPYFAALDDNGKIEGIDLGLDGQVNSIVQDNQGRILIAGNFKKILGENIGGLARLNPDFTLDESFKVTFDSDLIGRIKLLSDGHIVVMGVFNTVNGKNRQLIALLNEDGTIDNSLDPQFKPKVFNSITDFAETQTGDYYMWGSFETLDGKFALIKYNSNFEVDSSFQRPDFKDSPPFVYYPQHMAELSTGKILLAGTYSLPYGSYFSSHGFTLMDKNGKVQDDFQLYTDNVGRFIESPDGKIYISSMPISIRPVLPGTKFNPITGLWPVDMSFFRTSAVARLNADGSIDDSFVLPPTPLSGGNAEYSRMHAVYALELQDDGKLLVGGSFAQINKNVKNNYLLRMNTDGSKDDSFDVSISTNRDCTDNWIDTWTKPSVGVYAISLFKEPVQIIPQDGQCSITKYACTIGTVNSQTEDSVNYLWMCEGINGGNSVDCSLPKTAPPPSSGTTYYDIGLRFNEAQQITLVSDGSTINLNKIAAVDKDKSPLRISKNGIVYGIALVPTNHALASPIRIKTSSGVMALRLYIDFTGVGGPGGTP